MVRDLKEIVKQNNDVCAEAASRTDKRMRTLLGDAPTEKALREMSRADFDALRHEADKALIEELLADRAAAEAEARDWERLYRSAMKINADIRPLTEPELAALYDIQLEMTDVPGFVDEMSASEAVYSVLGWLTTRKQAITFSSANNAAQAAELAEQFCAAWGLKEPSRHWLHTNTPKSVTDKLHPHE
jgi:hypothetical protein